MIVSLRHTQQEPGCIEVFWLIATSLLHHPGLQSEFKTPPPRLMSFLQSMVALRNGGVEHEHTDKSEKQKLLGCVWRLINGSASTDLRNVANVMHACKLVNFHKVLHLHLPHHPLPQPPRRNPIHKLPTPLNSHLPIALPLHLHHPQQIVFHLLFRTLCLHQKTYPQHNLHLRLINDYIRHIGFPGRKSR
jgi:hypothetical protein